MKLRPNKVEACTLRSLPKGRSVERIPKLSIRKEAYAGEAGDSLFQQLETLAPNL